MVPHNFYGELKILNCYQVLGNNMHDHRGRKRRWDTMAIL